MEVCNRETLFGVRTSNKERAVNERVTQSKRVRINSADPSPRPNKASTRKKSALRPVLELNQNSRPKREKNQKPSMVPHFFIDGPKVLVQEFSSGGARREFGEFSSSGTGFEPDQKK